MITHPTTIKVHLSLTKLQGFHQHALVCRHWHTFIWCQHAFNTCRYDLIFLQELDFVHFYWFLHCSTSSCRWQEVCLNNSCIMRSDWILHGCVGFVPPPLRRSGMRFAWVDNCMQVVKVQESEAYSYLSWTSHGISPHFFKKEGINEGNNGKPDSVADTVTMSLPKPNSATDCDFHCQSQLLVRKLEFHFHLQ